MGFIDTVRSLIRPHWGVHPDDHKRPAADVPVRRMPVPARLYVPLVQHIGAPARPLVVVGQTVAKGDCIAAPQGPVSAAIHAPTSGTVVAIGDIVAPHPSGLGVAAITIESDGEDRWAADLPACDDPTALEPDEIGRRVAAAGVVGLGGAAFPSAVKLTGAARSQVATLVVNGGECEPYLSCDDRLMRDQAVELIDGIALMLHATGARDALVGVEDNKPEAIAALCAAAAAGTAPIRIQAVPARYPMGSEKQLILALTGREVPANGRPSDVGVVVHNVGTVLAVREALRFGRPLISRLVTVNGGAVAHPGNVEVRIGTLAEEVLTFCGGLAQPGARRVMGGPMMGSQLASWRVPIVKGTSGLLALTADEVAAQAPGPCVRCGSCVQACPVGLLPLEMSRHIAASDLAGAVRYGLKDCLACGCCAYVCPSRIPLVQYFQHARGELAAQERSKLKQEATRKLATARTARLEQEAREKAEAAARRKAERDAAKAKAAGTAADAPASNPLVSDQPTAGASA